MSPKNQIGKYNQTAKSLEALLVANGWPPASAEEWTQDLLYELCPDIATVAVAYNSSL